MKEASFTPFGMLPSLQERMSRCSKSRLRVSSTPMTCIPSIGSPWNGMEVPPMSWAKRRSRVERSACRSPLSISSNSRLTSVYILNTLSVKSASSDAHCVPTCFSTFCSQAKRLRLASASLHDEGARSAKMRAVPSSTASCCREG